jgi:hypothetical protein
MNTTPTSPLITSSPGPVAANRRCGTCGWFVFALGPNGGTARSRPGRCEWPLPKLPVLAASCTSMRVDRWPVLPRYGAQCVQWQAKQKAR